ncbi:MAG: thiamine diphosphokinase [Candidatus Syntrophosphaera sp.]|nr:thiamine diphosphokinase [Candidatus Syntrophosphaera sp.]
MRISRKKAWLFTARSPEEIFSSYASIDPGADLLVAVDGGLERVDRLGLKPSLIIGDMDSVSPALLKRYSRTCQLAYPSRKNESDTELAILWCLEQEAGEIVICNDLEGRFDHALALVQNLSLARQRGVEASIESERQRLFWLEENTSLEGCQGCVISLFAWRGKALFRDSEGLDYSLQDLAMAEDQTRGLSNRIIAPEARIKLISGQVLAILAK